MVRRQEVPALSGLFQELEDLLDGDGENPEGEMEEDLPVPPDVDGLSAMAILQVAVYALHAGAVPEAFGAVGFEFGRVPLAETTWIDGETGTDPMERL